jgi:glutamate synthase (ferredoxin)
MEPWDGPASIPLQMVTSLERYWIEMDCVLLDTPLTKSGFVIMSSEIGVLDIKPEDVIQHGRLEPGKCFG